MKAMQNGSFTYGYYKTLLEILKSRGYEFRYFTEDQDDLSVVLRHDVDADIFSAVDLCNAEKEQGAKSTWFLQPNNDVYNMLSDFCIKTAEKLKDGGAQIGLHIDASLYRDTAELTESVQELYAMYRRYLPLSPVFSFHRPGLYPGDFDAALEIQGLTNAYAPRFFIESAYVSDSNRREFWKEFRLWDAMENNKPICLLIHPLWWKEREMSDMEIVSYLEKQTGFWMGRNAVQKNIKRFAEIGEDGSI